MREILFRGKTVGDNEWVYGYLFVDQRGAHYICDTNNDGDGGIDMRRILVKSETVGQYTGLRDKNGQRIFEGDIVISTSENRLSTRPHLVKFSAIKGDCYCNPERKPVVIGNIYDNPELLEVQE